jgi:hypothetical protein
VATIHRQHTAFPEYGGARRISREIRIVTGSLLQELTVDFNSVRAIFSDPSPWKFDDELRWLIPSGNALLH